MIGLIRIVPRFLVDLAVCVEKRNFFQVVDGGLPRKDISHKLATRRCLDHASTGAGLVRKGVFSGSRHPLYCSKVILPLNSLN